MTDSYEAVEAAAAAIRARVKLTPTVGVVLGSGLGAWADTLADRVVVPYAEVPGMPTSSVVGHAGNLVIGRVGQHVAACLQGRVHLYEGHAPDRVVFGVRLLARLGCRSVVLTNAAGGIRRTFAPGDLMLLSDHLNLMGENPLRGPNDARFGTRFPDMTEAYSRKLREAAIAAGRETGVRLHEGVYAGLLGPTYETPAEIHMLRTLGADAVGMSTVPEVIALRHMGVRVGAISCITNLAAGLSPTPLNHAEVEETAKRTKAAFTSLLSAWVGGVAALPEEQGA